MEAVGIETDIQLSRSITDRSPMEPLTKFRPSLASKLVSKSVL